MKTFADRFNELFDILGNAEQENIFNEWASETGNEQIYLTEDFDDIMSGFEPLRVACMVRYGDFNPHYPAFTFNGYGNLESIENTAEHIDDYVHDMCNYFEDHQERLAELAGSAWEEVCEEEEEEGRTSADFWKVTPRFFEDNFIAL